MNREHFPDPDLSVSRFLDEVTEQISYEPLRPSIRQELESHIQERIEDYKADGLTSGEAEDKALRGMGDAVAIGTDLNEIHRIQAPPLFLTVITTVLLLAGFVAAGFMRWSPEQHSDGFLYYIGGGVLLVLTARKGYPVLVRHRKAVAISLCLLYVTASAAGPILTDRFGLLMGHGNIAYFALLGLAPVITVLLYRYRDSRKRLFISMLACAGIHTLLMRSTSLFAGDTAAMIFILTLFSTVCFMIHRRAVDGRKRTRYTVVPTGLALYAGALAGLALFISPLFLTAHGRSNMQAFLSPRTMIRSTWDDTYNGVLIRELLSRTPLTRGISLTPEEMMEYGTGAWYFASRDTREIGMDATGYSSNRQLFESYEDWEPGTASRYIHYNEGNVTLWNILPQHYHNNYVIAVCILLFGWLAGLALTGTVGLFYLFLFSCILRIRGHLASALAFCCGQCLLWQGIFYLLGNLGYQYASFPNMPLISEGRVSIMFNLVLLGMILSAYRFDRVIDEPAESEWNMAHTG